MARYQNRLNRIFSAGIVWDPEEPLPEELQDGRFRSNSETQDILDVLNFRTGFSAAAHVDGPFRGPTQITHPPTQSGQQIAAIWPVEGAKKNLPRFTVQEQGRNVLPPLSVTVDASIVQDTARVTVTQLFWNDSGIPIKKAAFTFPLAAGCTVTDFSCRIGANKIIKGAVKPKEEAREAFRDHIRQHETAAGLLEQETPEIFTTTLGNVPEKTKVKVELTYISVLKHRFADNNNTTTLTIPTSIAPRYGDAPEEYSDAATTNVPQGLSLEVEIVESEKISSIVSPSHAIAVTRRRGARTAQSFADLAGDDDRSNVETASVALESGRIFLDKDFVLDIVTTPDDNNENPQAWLEEHPTVPNHKTLMLTLPSGFLARQAPPVQQSEILFLADCSGSMKDKIKPLRSAMQFFLKGIPVGRKFNIWCFGTKYASWQPQSVDYTEETLNSALSWVKTDMRANMGGTELLPAVQAIVAAREKALMTDVIVLTDGQTWRLEQTLDFIQKTRGLTEGRVRFFALGIGRAVSHALVDGIAKAGGGYAEVIQEASQGGWEDRVVSMAKAALMSAHLGPLHLEFNIQDQTGNMRSSTLADAKRSPADISALNPFDRSRVYFHLDCLKDSESIRSVRIEVQANYDTQALNIPVTILDKRDTTLHRLAARAMLEDLERGRSHIHLGPNRPIPGSWQETNMVRKEAEAIACKWSLVSKWTSFFLAEEPGAPTGDDDFMGGVVEIQVSPGDDLLQPHGAVKHIAAIEIVDPQIQIPAINDRPARYHSRTPGDSSASFPVRSLLDIESQYAKDCTLSQIERARVQSRSRNLNIPGQPQVGPGGVPRVTHERSSDARRSVEPHGYPLAARSQERASRTRASDDEQMDAMRERLRGRFDSSEESKETRARVDEQIDAMRERLCRRFKSEQSSRGKGSDPGSPTQYQHSDGECCAGPKRIPHI
ncbi:von Willebrand factor type A domain-containing protein [Chaetomium tenue]|uniref:von Willebrand factor type A domain-containing protein n=1 Tax=Chaetomium tenue TaxID=1854479 RepID=A0ACB7PHL3_9PEZI|nr:von Willebrand factor type A domain-containing protein [Chaetomium globosum]